MMFIYFTCSIHVLMYPYVMFAFPWPATIIAFIYLERVVNKGYYYC